MFNLYSTKLFLILLYLLSCLVWTSNLFAADIERIFQAQEIDQIDVSNIAGTVRFAATSTNSITVRLNKIRFDRGCTIKFNVVKRVVFVSVEKARPKETKHCEVNIDIVQPRTLASKLRLGVGNAYFTAVNAAITFKIGAGNVVVKRSKIPQLTGKIGIGDVTIANMQGSASIKTGSGNVTVSLRDHNPKILTNLLVSLGTGNTTLLLPKKSRIKIQTKIGYGRIDNSFRNHESDATISVHVRAGVGNLTIAPLPKSDQ